MGKAKSIITKGLTLLKDGLDPVEEGLNNFNNKNNDIELLARDRIKICVGCPFYKDEPVDFLKVLDSDIEEASGKFCSKCGCTLPYKIRQTLKPCKIWQRKE